MDRRGDTDQRRETDRWVNGQTDGETDLTSSRICPYEQLWRRVRQYRIHSRAFCQQHFPQAPVAVSKPRSDHGVQMCVWGVTT